VFWGVAYAYLVTMLGTTLPAPLYGLYQQRLGLSAEILTVIFAVYAAGFLIALLLFGAFRTALAGVRSSRRRWSWRW
jgi:hypothetical protein